MERGVSGSGEIEGELAREGEEEMGQMRAVAVGDRGDGQRAQVDAETPEEGWRPRGLSAGGCTEIREEG